MVMSAIAAKTLANDSNIEIELQQLAASIRAGDWNSMRSQADSLRSRGVDLGTEILYFEGRGAFEQKDFETAEAAFIAYTERGPDVRYYEKALRYLKQTETTLAPERANEALRASLEIISRQWPTYPRRAVQSGIMGWVRVQFDVSERGEVFNAKVIGNCRSTEKKCSNAPGNIFDKAALAAVSQYKFKPQFVDGVAVSVSNVIEVVYFRL